MVNYRLMFYFIYMYAEPIRELQCIHEYKTNNYIFITAN